MPETASGMAPLPVPVGAATSGGAMLALAPPLSVGAGMGGGRQLREMGRPMPLPSSGAGSVGPSMLLLPEAASTPARS